MNYRLEANVEENSWSKRGSLKSSLRIFMQICVFLDTGKGKQLEQSFAYFCMLGFCITCVVATLNFLQIGNILYKRILTRKFLLLNESFRSDSFHESVKSYAKGTCKLFSSPLEIIEEVIRKCWFENVNLLIIKTSSF